MKAKAGWLVVVLFQACGVPQNAPSLEQPGDENMTGLVGSSQPSNRADICGGGHVLNFRIGGTGLSAWEGHVVRAAVNQDDWPNWPNTFGRPVLLNGSIQNGAFSLECQSSLDVNYGYPSWAVFVDVDGDGKCSGADVGAHLIFYGWNDHVEAKVDAADLQVLSNVMPPNSTNVWLPMGSTAADFCDGYFF
ncbi:MAG: hypothetical protein K1X64_03770 [Myxococcaceae bacterium]|nr:hypothetical protein [Myxococcaceae bacterium]